MMRLTSPLPLHGVINMGNKKKNTKKVKYFGIHRNANHIKAKLKIFLYLNESKDTNHTESESE